MTDQQMSHSQMGWKYYIEKDYSLAEMEFAKAVEEDPVSIDSLYALGLVLKAEKAVDKARQTFTRVLELASTLDDSIRSTMFRNLVNRHLLDLEENQKDHA